MKYFSNKKTYIYLLSNSWLFSMNIFAYLLEDPCY